MYYQTMETKNVDYGAALAVLIVVLGVVLSKVVNAQYHKQRNHRGDKQAALVCPENIRRLKSLSKVRRRE